MLDWIGEQLSAMLPDIVVLCGNHAFRWYGDLQNAANKCRAIVIHPNALNYLPVSNKRILFVADETEFGRQLYETFGLCRGRGIAYLAIATVFLNGASNAVQRREKSCTFLSSKIGDDRMFATALRGIRAWKPFADNRPTDAHTNAAANLLSFQ